MALTVTNTSSKFAQYPHVTVIKRNYFVATFLRLDMILNSEADRWKCYDPPPAPGEKSRG